MRERLLDPKILPATLWTQNRCILLPEMLTSAYKSRLSALGIFDEAENDQLKGTEIGGAIGGESTEDAREHFTHTYATSSGRLQLAMLDPHSALGETSNLLIKTLAGGHVGFLEVPCGSGAAGAAIISTLTELRAKQVIPRLPLTVKLVGGDISADALQNANEIMNELSVPASEQAITVVWSFNPWDVQNATQTTSLIANWVSTCHECNFHLISIASFSGYLYNKVAKVSERLGEILRWGETRSNSFTLWTEPATNKSNEMAAAVVKYVAKFAAWISLLAGRESQLKTTESRVILPLCPENTRRVTLRVLQVD